MSKRAERPSSLRMCPGVHSRAFRALLAGAFLALLAASAPHRVHHLGERLAKLLPAGAHAHGNPLHDYEGGRDRRRADPPLGASHEAPCVLEAAGNRLTACAAQTPTLAIRLLPAAPPSSPVFFVARHAVPRDLSPRAPPAV